MKTIVVVAFLLPSLALAQVPQRVGYQGRLLKADGTPESGTIQITFSAFAGATGGSSSWSEMQTVALTDGYYAVQLGDVTPLPATVFDGTDRWLELSIAGTALTPRQRVGSVPYAMTCASARNVTGGTVNASSISINGAPVTDVNGKVDWTQMKSCANPGDTLQWTAGGWACQPALASIFASAPLTGDGRLGTPVAMAPASGSEDGYLTATDWAAFDSKAPGAGSTSYLQNQTGSSQNASFSISGTGVIGGDLMVGGRILRPLGEARDNPATSCAVLLQTRPGVATGVYWLQPSTASVAFEAYCDMTNEGGGWTLVWSNLRGGRGKPATELQFKAAINTLPRVRGVVSANLESFEVYTGLAHWIPLALNALTPKFRYDWAPDYGSAIDQRWTADYALLPGNAYQISFTNGSSRIGTVAPGIFTGSNNARFTAYDVDNDTAPTNCAASYSNSPWWYTNCWSGSPWGGGELSGGYVNGAYWTASPVAWGAAGGTGGGNGWYYVK